MLEESQHYIPTEQWIAPEASNMGETQEKQDLLVNVKSVFYTFRAFSALKEDGSVVVWGNKYSGGDAGKKQSQLTDVTHVGKSSGAFAVRRRDGKEVVWGIKGNQEAALKNLHQVVTLI